MQSFHGKQFTMYFKEVTKILQIELFGACKIYYVRLFISSITIHVSLQCEAKHIPIGLSDSIVALKGCILLSS